jgi:hypothetical protein
MSQKINGLTAEQRGKVYDGLRAEIAGKKPAEGDSSSSGSYPPLVIGVVLGLLTLAFVGAAYPSFWRLVKAGRESFFSTIPNESLANLAGVMTFLLATFLIVVSTVSMRLFFDGTKLQKFWFIPIAVGVGIEALGNYIVVKPDTYTGAHQLFAYLETFGPPVVFAFLALTAERLLLDRVVTRKRNAAELKVSLDEWQQKYELAHENAAWKRKLPTALKNALIEANIEKRPAAVRAMTGAEWKQAVMAEFEDENWFEREEALPAPKPQKIVVERPAQPKPQELPAPTPPSGEDSVTKMRNRMKHNAAQWGNKGP